MILFALDLAGNRIYIETAHSGTTYICEECGTRLMAKNKGSERQHHFAHIPDEKNKGIQRDCKWRSDLRTENQMSAWHQAWQSQYPPEQREVVFRQGEQIFRADVCLPQRREVIEFQHSRITSSDFHARNNFYNSLGYKVIWLFDFDELDGRYQYIPPDQYDDFVQDFVREGQKVYAMDQDIYRSTFGDWKAKSKNVHVCFMRTYNQWRFYSYIKIVTGSFEYDMPMHLFVVEMKEKDFMKRIGIREAWRLQSLLQSI